MQIDRDIIAFSPNGKALPPRFPRITFRDLSTGNVIQTIEGHQKNTASLIVNPLEEKFCSTRSTERPPCGMPIKASSASWTESGGFQNIEFSPDGKTFLLKQEMAPSAFGTSETAAIYLELRTLIPSLCRTGRILRLSIEWQLSSSALRNRVGPHPARAQRKYCFLASSPDGKLLASASDDKTVKVWNWEAGQASYSLDSPRFKFSAVAFSPDGKVLATGDGNDAMYVRSGGRQIKLWEASSGKPLRSLGDHEEATSLAFSADGKWLASSSKDKSIKIWNTSDGWLVQNLEKLTQVASSSFLVRWKVFNHPR